MFHFVARTCCLLLLLLSFSCDSSSPAAEATTDPVAEPLLGAAGGDDSVPYFLTVEKAFDTRIGLHSYALGRVAEGWIIVGGRTNGYHGTGGNSSRFPAKRANDSVYLIQPAANQVSAAALPPGYRAALSSTSMSSVQVGKALYCVGGYGNSCADGRMTDECYQTYPFLTILDLPAIARQLTQGAGVLDPASFYQVKDDRFRVAGGGLCYVNGTFYLVFGQNYAGMYQPGRNGEYTEQVRTFSLTDRDGPSPQLADYSFMADSTGNSGPASQFHRRDLNVVPVIHADGTVGVDVYGGVFTADDGAYLRPVSITGSATKIHGNNLKVGLYECAQAQLFDPVTKKMYTSLLGGIGGYYYNEAGTLVPDDLPFTRTISTVTHHPDDRITEHIQPYDRLLPAFIGGDAEFIPDPSLELLANQQIIDLSRLSNGSGRIMIGQMYGGVISSGVQSAESGGSIANPGIYNVYLTRTN